MRHIFGALQRLPPFKRRQKLCAQGKNILLDYPHHASYTARRRRAHNIQHTRRCVMVVSGQARYEASSL